MMYAPPLTARLDVQPSLQVEFDGALQSLFDLHEDLSLGACIARSAAVIAALAAKDKPAPPPKVGNVVEGAAQRAALRAFELAARGLLGGTGSHC